MERRRIVYLAAVLIVAGLIGAAYLYNTHRGEEGGSLLVDERFERLVKNVPETLNVKVEGIGPSGYIEEKYTCDGGDLTPKVVVSGIPEDAKAVVLIMYDPDAPYGTFIHWLAVAEARDGKAVLPDNVTVEGINDFRRIGYGGPCPPRGHGAHRYFFLAIAVDRDPGLKRGFSLSDLTSSIRGHMLAYGYTMGKYER